MTPRVCYLVPTFNNPDTIVRVVEELRPFPGFILVVDDGSDPECAARIDAIEGIELVRHSRNRGKGAALRSGFRRARELAASHTLSFDADGQHRAKDLPELLAELHEHPEALIVGCRNLREGGERRRRKSRLLRLNSNFWVWVETGQWVGDTQSGLRVYPLQPLARLELRGLRYDFEVEVLVKFLWARGAVRSVPVQVSYGPGSISHFQAGPDFLRVTRLNLWLLSLRFWLPLPLVRLGQRRGSLRAHALQALRRLAEARGGRARTCGSLALGGLLGCAPLWGVRRRVTRALADVVRLDADLAEDACLWWALPALLPLTVYGSCWLGGLALPLHTWPLQLLLGAMLLAAMASLLSLFAACGFLLGFAAMRPRTAA